MKKIRNIILYTIIGLVTSSCPYNHFRMVQEHSKPDGFFKERKYSNIAEAIYNNNDDLLKNYLKTYKDLDIDKLGKRGANLLMYSIIMEKYKMMQILLEHGADPNVKSYVIPPTQPIGKNSDRLCAQPLGIICEYYHRYNRKYVELLLKYGANVNDTICSKPPFIHAVGGSAYISTYTWRKKKELMTILLKNGANINIQDKSGKTALISARGIKWETTIEWLLDHGADYKITDNHNISVVHHIQNYLENFGSEEKFLAKSRALKKRLENEGVIFPKGPFFPVKQGERLPDIKYRK